MYLGTDLESHIHELLNELTSHLRLAAATWESRRPLKKNDKTSYFIELRSTIKISCLKKKTANEQYH